MNTSYNFEVTKRSHVTARHAQYGPNGVHGHHVVVLVVVGSSFGVELAQWEICVLETRKKNKSATKYFVLTGAPGANGVFAVKVATAVKCIERVPASMTPSKKLAPFLVFLFRLGIP